MVFFPVTLNNYTTRIAIIIHEYFLSLITCKHNVVHYTVHSVYHNYVLETLCLTFLHCCTFNPNTQPSFNGLSSLSAPHVMKSCGLAGLLSLSWRLTAEWLSRRLGQGWPGPPLASTLVHSCMHGRTHATMIMKTQLYTM